MPKQKQWSAGEEMTATKLNKTGNTNFWAHQQSTPNMTLYVEDGVVNIQGTIVKYAGGNSPSFTAPTSNPRIDLLVIGNTGTLSIEQGTEAASPSAPTYPTNKFVICEVYLRVGTTALYNDDQGSNGYAYKDVRPFIGGGGGFTSRIRVKRSSTQIISAATWGKIQFNSEDIDNLGEYDNSVNYRFTSQNGGTYRFSAAVYFYASNGSNRQLVIEVRKNGSSIGTISAVVPPTTINQSLISIDIVQLAAGDYIEVWAQSPIDTDITATNTFFAVEQIA